MSRGKRSRWLRRWRRLSSRTTAVLAVTLAVIAVALAAGAVAKVATSSPDTEGESLLTDSTEPPERSLLVVGDSWTTGGPANSGPEWWDRITLPDGWTRLTFAAGGVGYIGFEKGLDLRKSGRLDELTRDYDPDVALIALGRNDVVIHPTPDVLREARIALTAMSEAWPDATIVVFSPFSPTEPNESTIALTEGLQQISESLGLEFLDVSHIIGDRQQLIEDSHPNDRGHARLAQAIGSGLANLGVF